MISIMITLKITMIKNQNYYFSDTNNLMNEIKAGDVYEDYRTNKEIFDFSNSKYYACLGLFSVLISIIFCL